MFDYLFLNALKFESGLKQSEITVLEKHATYSLSEENRAAYFYIVQSTESSNDDIQLPIKTVLERLVPVTVSLIHGITSSYLPVRFEKKNLYYVLFGIQSHVYNLSNEKIPLFQS